MIKRKHKYVTQQEGMFHRSWEQAARPRQTAWASSNLRRSPRCGGGAHVSHAPAEPEPVLADPASVTGARGRRDKAAC